MKTTLNIDIAGFEMTKGDKKLTLNDGSKVAINVEYDASEVVEYIKALPQIISVAKDAILDITKAAKEFNAAETENYNARETTSTDNRIREHDAEYAREHRASSES